ncbi:hypothetical protein H2200_000619 [Cladophialophora chaetospira]|uniref:Uncharacterized protein n=1 Tax=Cladophialophora chaetospira TaxID=386627 RepID=A0AA39CPC4_9EURO|nr:hypothetical protein H2200_000619 [Cladophialophora chaetospira]
MENDTQNKEETTHDSYDSAPGGRRSGGEVARPATNAVSSDDKDSKPSSMPEGFSKRDVENMGGSLKVHVRLALKADIRITAEIHGDIVVGIL